MPGTRHHSAKWHRCVDKVGDSADSPEAVCTAVLGDASYEDSAGANEPLTESEYGAVERYIESMSSGGLAQIVRASNRPARVLEASRHKREALPGAKIIGAYDDAAREVPVQLLSTGPGNPADEHYYPDSAVESLCVVMEGGKALANHPSKFQDEVQPERTIQEQIGFYRNLHVVAVAEGKACQGVLRLLPGDSDLMKHTRALLTEAAVHARMYPTKDPLCGFSINADGLKERGEVNGQPYNIVHEFTRADSTDLVTSPAARGKVTGLMAVAREARRLGHLKEAREMKKQILSAIRAAGKKLFGAESPEDRAAAHAELEAMTKAAGMEDDAPVATAPTESEAEAAEAKKESERRAAEAKKREDESKEAAKRAAEAAVPAAESEAEAEADESSKPLPAEIREAAKLVATSNPALSASLYQRASAMEARSGQFSKLREAKHKAESTAAQALAQVKVYESRDRAERLIAEAELPEEVLSIALLVGKPEPEQREIVDDRKRMFEAMKRTFGVRTSSVEGAGAGVSVGANESAVAREALTKNHIPTVS